MLKGIRRALESDAMALIPALGFSPTGEAFNLSMEEVATRVASELASAQADFSTEVPGVATDPLLPISDDNPIDTEILWPPRGAALAQLPPAEKPTDTSFYLRHCVRACEHGVERSHILPFAVDGAPAVRDLRPRRHRHHGD